MVLTGYLRGVRLTTIILVENTVGVDADPVRVVPLKNKNGSIGLRRRASSSVGK